MPLTRIVLTFLLLAAPVLAQEIVVRGKGISISDGDSGPTTIDGTNLGSVDILTQTATSTFVIENTAPGTLTIGAITFSGTHASEFTVTTQPAATVPNGGSTPFEVTFDPAATGTRTATIEFPTNDPNENPFNFALRGTGISDPLIEVTGNGMVIPDNDSSPSAGDGTDFGTTSIGGPMVTRTFTITNTGSENVVLSGDMVRVRGGNSSDWSIPQIPASPIVPGASVNFDVVFSPTGIGPRNSEVQVLSNADNAATYNFDITGIGEAPEMNVRGNGASIQDGDTIPSTVDGSNFGTTDILFGTIRKSFVIENTGNIALGLGHIRFTGTHAANFRVTMPPFRSVQPGGSTTFELEFDPTIDGQHNATVEIGNTDADENPYNFAIRGTGDAEPEIDVRGKGLSIADGDNSPDIVDDTDFGTLNVTAGSETHTFTIHNLGSADLNLTGSRARIVGGHSSDFFIVALPATPIPPGGSASFDLTFDPTDIGPRNTHLEITSDDTDEFDYVFALTGFGTASGINVEGNGASIPNGDDTPKTTDNTLFGSTDINTGSIDKDFVIENLGNIALTIGTLSLAGDHPGDFSVLSPPAGSLNPGTDTGFSIRFDPSANGERNAVVVIPNSDPTQDPYAFSIRGTGTSIPEIDVQGNGVSIVDGDDSPDPADHTDFGGLPVTAGSTTRTFTIRNTGSADLALTDYRVRVNGGHASDFTIPTLPATPIAPGGSVNFDVIFDPSAFGPRFTSLEIASNDTDESDYNFTIQGLGSASEINVTGQNFDIPDGDTTPIVSDGTNFRSADVLGGEVRKTFVIESEGNVDLNLGTLSISGPNASNFTLLNQPATVIAPAGSSSFEIRFDPSFTGQHLATVNIPNDDPNEDPYTFDIRGDGIVATEIRVTGMGIEISDGDLSPDPADGTDFGSLAVAAGSQMRRFTIENTGSADLALSGSRVRLIGANANDFNILALPSTPIAPGGSVFFDVVFDPSDFGPRSTSVEIANNDPDESTYIFSIQGFGTAAEINLKGDRFDIPDGDSTPIIPDGTNFGTVDVQVGHIDQVFVIENEGNITLDIGPLNFNGAHETDFSFVIPPATSLLPGEVTAFKLRFNPSVAGERNAEIEIGNNDPDEAPYTFAIRGTGSEAEEIDIRGNGNSIADGDDTPSTLDFTDFGGADVSAGSVTRSFTIHNTGSRSLSLINFRARVIGANQSDFQIPVLPATPIGVGSSVSFDVIFNPSAAGLRSTNLEVESSDSDETRYSFVIQGSGTTGTAPDIAMFGNSQEISNGDSSPETGDNTRFPTIPISGGLDIRSFEIRNFGGGPLNLSTIQFTGSHGSDFSMAPPFPAGVVPPGGSTVLAVRFIPGGIGTRSATLEIGSDDGDEHPFTFAIEGVGRDTPELNLLGNNLTIKDSSTPNVFNHTHFGTVHIDVGPRFRTFTLVNSGSQPLNVSSLTLTGLTGFDMPVLAPFTLAVAETRDVDISFDPNARSGSRSAVLSIASDDPEGDLNINLEGIGVGFELLGVEDELGTAVIRFNANRNDTVFTTYTYTLESNDDFPDGPWTPLQTLIGVAGTGLQEFRHFFGFDADHRHWRIVETADP